MSFGRSHLNVGPRLEPLSKRLPGSVVPSTQPGTRQVLVTRLEAAVTGISSEQGETAHRPTTIRNPGLQTEQFDRRVIAVLSWMEENLGTSVSLEGIAMSLNISVSRLRHLFKEETGNTPMHQLKLMRLLRARELLRDSFLSLKQVMNMVGIADISHFVRDYKRVYGETPGRARRTYGADEAVDSQSGQQLAISAKRYNLISPTLQRTVR